ncbi:MAG TPA: RecQ family ATP-dependent DNA helicase [Solirubrobacteraceae bacterium]|jgi:ATP-dependent DNA helicase RecQ
MDLSTAPAKQLRLAPPSDPSADPRAELRRCFGFDDFRPGQREAVEGALAGRDVLVVMPTGAGKSLCYQLPALMRDDLTVVVSPLVSLMQDQVEALERAAPGSVALVNAQRDSETNRIAVSRAARGEHKLLYVAPERFSSPGFLEQLRDADVGLFVVDEAHCVSQWGHDFRPDYFRLADAARWLGAKAIVASTATATPQVAVDIAQRLGLRDPVRVATGFDRPNLSFAVVRCKSRADKERRLIAALEDDGAVPAIVYAGTRARTEELAARLGGALGCDVLAYHAGLGREARAEAQRRFMTGEVDVVVATNAFGMGVDKADVRTVAHDGVPGSLEAYYQEAGRAGRDGAPSRSLLFAEGRDKGLHVFFIQRGEVKEDDVARVARVLARAAGEGETAAAPPRGSAPPGGDRPPSSTLQTRGAAPRVGGASARYDVALDDLVTRDCEEDAVRAILGHLARAGVIQPAPSTPDRARGRLAAPFDGRARAACRSFAGEAQRVRWRQYRSVWAFVESGTCRRETILRHFGDRAAARPEVPCCDVCAPQLVPAPPPPPPSARRSSGSRGGSGSRSSGLEGSGDLDDAILDVVETADPTVGRTRAVEILRGGRSKVVKKYSYDGLPGYGAFAHLSNDEVLARVDELIRAGRLRSTGGAYPKLAAVK